jgi:16S rRNA (adenine1518-N6/adenine1519-N6)-dimethyltransferase
VSRQRLGQHFLNKASILDRIARAACPDPEPLVIEIGPGRGALTERLLERSERVIAVEIDSGLVELLREKFRDEPRLTVLHTDALDIDFGQWGPAVVAGNLPYYAATPIIQKVLSLGHALRRGVFLLQKEVAARFTASPGSRDYGYLSIQTQLFADVEALFDVSPSAFRPPPKVDSTLVRLHARDRAAELEIRNTAKFLVFVGLCFRQKRKTLRNNLAGAYRREMLDAWPEAGKRAEQLTLEQIAELYRRVTVLPLPEAIMQRE